MLSAYHVHVYVHVHVHEGSSLAHVHVHVHAELWCTLVFATFHWQLGAIGCEVAVEYCLTFEVDIHAWDLLFLLLLLIIIIFLFLLLLVLLPSESEHGSGAWLLIDELADISTASGKVESTLGDVVRAASKRSVLPTLLHGLGTLLLQWAVRYASFI